MEIPNKILIFIYFLCVILFLFDDNEYFLFDRNDFFFFSSFFYGCGNKGQRREHCQNF